MNNETITQFQENLEQLKKINDLLSDMQDRQQRHLDALKEKKEILEARDIADYMINA
jgi:hypothetical protein